LVRLPEHPVDAVTLSSSCAVEQLCLSAVDHAPELEGLGVSAVGLGGGRQPGDGTVWRWCARSHDLGQFPLTGWEPVRRFVWQTGQRHRPGLQFLVSTGRHHGFESIAEQRLLLALDFAGRVDEVFSQPFGLRYERDTGWHTHVPDFLAVSGTGVLVVDVRPGDRIGAEDRVAFAATAEVALAAGWRYVVVTGWRGHVMTNVDAFSAQRRPLADRAGLQGAMLRQAAAAATPFGELVERAGPPALARAHALHLLWHRRLGIDVMKPLNDASTVWSRRRQVSRECRRGDARPDGRRGAGDRG
jgi:hypothetical protein